MARVWYPRVYAFERTRIEKTGYVYGWENLRDMEVRHYICTAATGGMLG